MSRMGNHRIELQEHSDYELGFKDRKEAEIFCAGDQGISTIERSL